MSMCRPHDVTELSAHRLGRSWGGRGRPQVACAAQGALRTLGVVSDGELVKQGGAPQSCRAGQFGRPATVSGFVGSAQCCRRFAGWLMRRRLGGTRLTLVM